MVDRARRFTFRRQAMECLLHPFAQVIEQRPGSRPPHTHPKIGGLAANLNLDRIKSADPGHRFGCGRRSMHHMDFVKLAPGMGPAG